VQTRSDGEVTFAVQVKNLTSSQLCICKITRPFKLHNPTVFQNKYSWMLQSRVVKPKHLNKKLFKLELSKFSNSSKAPPFLAEDLVCLDGFHVAQDVSLINVSNKTAIFITLKNLCKYSSMADDADEVLEKVLRTEKQYTLQVVLAYSDWGREGDMRINFDSTPTYITVINVGS